MTSVSIPLETKSDSLPESTSQLTPALGAAVAIDGNRLTWGPLKYAFFARDMCLHSNNKTHNLVPLHRNHELACSHLRFMLFNFGRDRNVIGCSVHVCELSWTMSDGDLTTYTAFTSITWGIFRNRTRFMLILDPTELEVAPGCFLAMHANLGWGSIRHGAALDSFPFFFGAGELVLLVSLVAAAALSSCL